MPLLDPYGRPYSSEHFRKPRRVPTPGEVVTGNVIGQWDGRDLAHLDLPGGTVLQFDLSKLTLADFRSMRMNYQISASLNVLTFILYEIDWHIDCESKQIADVVEKNVRQRWTRLLRAMSQAFWAGYSPNVLVYENDPNSGYLVLNKIKDLVPEECKVQWRWEDGVATPDPDTPSGASSARIKPKIAHFDGIRHLPISELWGWSDGGFRTVAGSVGGAVEVIPPENSLWYPLFMENGDYYGRKLLKPAFPAYYFSQLIHLFANRYFERFGEPVPVGRANYDDDIVQADGSTMSGKRAMEQLLTALRNRSVVVLPSDRDPITKEYEYAIEYLESQMRGADFERYLTRLDEEMSLALFTPILLFRTADVGSYNLGNIHVQIFQQMLNALAGDMKEYLDEYVVDRLKTFNFGENAPTATWEFRPMGRTQALVLQSMIQSLVSNKQVMPDIEELSTAIGIPLHEVKDLTQPPPDPNADPNNVDPTTGQPIAPPSPNSQPARQALRSVLDEAVARAGREIANSWPSGTFSVQLGFRRRFETGLRRLGYDTEEATTEAELVYGRVNRFLEQVSALGAAEFGGPEDVRDSLGKLIDHEAQRYAA